MSAVNLVDSLIGAIGDLLPMFAEAAVQIVANLATGLGDSLPTLIPKMCIRDSYKTTNLLETTGGKTQIVFGNWNDLVIGEQGALEIETSREGSWTNDAGNLVSAFENDQTLIRAINNVDTEMCIRDRSQAAEKSP